MVKKEGKRIIGILVGVVRDDEVDFNTPIPEAINSANSSILNIKNYNSNNFEEIKVTFSDTRAIEIWEWQI